MNISNNAFVKFLGLVGIVYYCFIVLSIFTLGVFYSWDLHLNYYGEGIIEFLTAWILFPFIILFVKESLKKI